MTPNSQMESVAVTVYAQWQANSYPITFDPAGGTLNESLKMAYYDSPLGELPELQRQADFYWMEDKQPNKSCSRNSNTDDSINGARA